MHGVRRVIIFCLLTTVLPITLLVIPLYLRHNLYADVVYAVTESDILEIIDGVSTIFCSTHTLQMNGTFNAFQMGHRPEITSYRKHIRLKKSMTLPDDTLEYWGFYLLRGATVALSVCSRFPGSSILVVKGERSLRTCGLLDHNKNKAHTAGIYLPQADQQVKITFESNAQVIEYEEPTKTITHVSNDTLDYKLKSKKSRDEKSAVKRPNDVDEEELAKLTESARSYMHKHMEQHESKNENITRRLRHTRRRLDNKIDYENHHKKQKKKIDHKNHHKNLKNIKNHRKHLENIKNHHKHLESIKNHHKHLENIENHHKHLENIKNHHKHLENIENHRKHLKNIKNHHKHLEKNHNIRSSKKSTQHKSDGSNRRKKLNSLKEQLNFSGQDKGGEETDETGWSNNEKRGRHRRNQEPLKPPALLDHGIQHGGNALKNSSESSVSSFEEGLLNCYEGQVLLTQEFDPSELCTNVSYLVNGKHMQTRHDVAEDGYYYYIFYSDNDIVFNDIHAVFDIYKPTFQYENVTKSCLNQTECSFPLTMLSNDRVIVEVPTKDGIDHEQDDISVLVSVCHPRMGMYTIFPIALLFLIISCAFM